MSTLSAQHSHVPLVTLGTDSFRPIRSLLCGVLCLVISSCGGSDPTPVDGGNDPTPLDGGSDLLPIDEGVDIAILDPGMDMATDEGQELPPPAPLDYQCQRVEEGHGPLGQVDFQLETVASGLEVPWSIAFLPDGDMLVTVRGGKLLRIKPNGTVVDPPVATLTLLPSGEGGLLGLALHPNFEENNWFYLYFTTELNGKRVNRVQRWILASDGQSASPVDMIIDQIPAKTYHNGGRLRFGPDNKLYVGTGDAGVPEVSQDPQSLAGKILRLNDDGSIPNDNPFPGSAAYVIGVRNSQGFDWRDDGRMFIVDHGPSGFGVEDGRMNHDEVHIAEAGDNLGWPNIYACEEAEGMHSPLMTWADALPPGGAAIYRGTTISAWQGDLFVGVLGFGGDIGHLHRLQINDGGQVIRSEVYLHGAEGFGRMREVIMGPDGHLYVTTSNCDGRNECPTGKDRILRLK